MGESLNRVDAAVTQFLRPTAPRSHVRIGHPTHIQILQVPQHSKSMKDKDWASDVFGSGGGYAQVGAHVQHPACHRRRSALRFTSPRSVLLPASHPPRIPYPHASPYPLPCPCPPTHPVVQFMATVKATGPLASQYGSNALQLAVFSEMFRVDTAVRAISVSYSGRTWGWEDICEVNFSGTCKYSGYGGAACVVVGVSVAAGDRLLGRARTKARYS